MDTNQSNFYQFSDQLRLQNSNLANLTLNDSIWSTSYSSKRAGDRRNFDIRVGGEVSSGSSNKPEFDYNGWNKVGSINSNLNIVNSASGYGSMPASPAGGGGGVNGGFNKGIYSTPPPPMAMNNFNYVKGINNNNNVVGSGKGLYFGKNGKDNSEEFGMMMQMGKGAKKNGKIRRENAKENNNGNSNNGEGKSAAIDKRFKTLPPAEALPRNETIGGYIFVCNNDTMQENLKRQLFGLPPRYRDSVRAITPGLPLFLYNYSTHQLHGIFEAASFGGTNIDPSAWEDKKNPGESRFPAQVRVVTRKICEPMEEDSFRPILHHYDGPKFRLELNVPEALSLLDIFDEIDTSNKTLENIVNRAISTI